MNDPKEEPTVDVEPAVEAQVKKELALDAGSIVILTPWASTTSPPSTTNVL